MSAADLVSAYPQPFCFSQAVREDVYVSNSFYLAVSLCDQD